MERALLGETGIEVSKLCFGTGTDGWGGRSDQSSIGVDGLADLLRYAYDCGVTFWDTADQYGTHRHVRAALQHLPRERIVVTSKTVAKDPQTARADVERFLVEMGTEYIDVLLLHCMTDPAWPEAMRPVMDELTALKSEGKIGALGVSCHDFQAFCRAATHPWVEVVLARINYRGDRMCASPAEVVPVLQQMHDAGKGVYGMKVVGGGSDLTQDVRKAFRFALGLPSLDAITVGMRSRAEIDENVGLVNEFVPAGV